MVRAVVGVVVKGRYIMLNNVNDSSYGFYYFPHYGRKYKRRETISEKDVDDRWLSSSLLFHSA